MWLEEGWRGGVRKVGGSAPPPQQASAVLWGPYTRWCCITTAGGLCCGAHWSWGAEVPGKCAATTHALQLYWCL